MRLATTDEYFNSTTCYNAFSKLNFICKFYFISFLYNCYYTYTIPSSSISLIIKTLIHETFNSPFYLLLIPITYAFRLLDLQTFAFMFALNLSETVKFHYNINVYDTRMQSHGFDVNADCRLFCFKYAMVFVMMKWNFNFRIINKTHNVY